METTRHFTATVYVVHDGETTLHRHDRQDKWLPPGGHVERDELPHEAARREVREELGLEATLSAEVGEFSSTTVEPLPEPRHMLLADVNVHDGTVGHQHVDLVYYASVPSKEIDPAPGEQSAADWEWFGPADLDAASDRVDSDVREIGRQAIDVVSDGDADDVCGG